MAKITLWGIESFLKNREESVFDNLVFPDGIVKADVADNIMLKAGEFEVLYADPDFMKQAISLWGRKYFRTFEKWITALNIEYNPLENYDRIEEWTDNKLDSSTASTTDVQTGSQNSTLTNSQDTTNKVSAFDSSDFSNKDKSETSGSGTNVTTNSNNSNINSLSNGSEDTTHHGRLHGNIGVTTSQQMLESELNIAKWNLIEQITDLYISEFCIAIY